MPSGEASTPAKLGMTKEQAELLEQIQTEGQAFNKTLTPEQQKVREEGKELNKQRNEAIKAKDTAKQEELEKALEDNQKTFEASLQGDQVSQYGQIKTDCKTFNESMRSTPPAPPANS